MDHISPLTRAQTDVFPLPYSPYKTKGLLLTTSFGGMEGDVWENDEDVRYKRPYKILIRLNN